MISFLIVGSGYRSEYFARVAVRYPDLFRAMYLCRSQAKVELMKAHTGLSATMDETEALSFVPDFVVIAVDRGHMFEVAESWIRKGFPVVTETPVGASEEQLKALWQLQQEGAKIVCCEQYHRQPLLAEGLRAVSAGLIGTPTSMYLSLLHDYHGASLIRRALLVPPEEPYTVFGVGQDEPVIETDSRGGAVTDGRRKTDRRMTAVISFESGKQAIYDFCSVQYRSYIRSRHLVLRGDRGEWSDTIISCVGQHHHPETHFLLPRISEKYQVLDTQALRDRRRNWESALAPDTVQDEFAIATILLDMKDYLKGGPSPYPLKEAVADACFWLSLQNAEMHPFEKTESAGLLRTI